jgi:hypothetical protein
MSEAQARELLIEHIDTMIHMDEVGGLDWDDAQSRWWALYVTGSKIPQQRPKRDNDAESPQKRPKRDHDEKKEVALASPRRAPSTSTIAWSDDDIETFGDAGNEAQ